jgi:hypothetical protein
MWGKLRQAELRCVVFDNMPDHAIRHEITPGLSGSTNAAK